MAKAYSEEDPPVQCKIDERILLQVCSHAPARNTHSSVNPVLGNRGGGRGGNTNPNMNQFLANLSNMWLTMNGQNCGGTARTRKPRIHYLGDVSKTLPNVEGDSKQPLQLEWPDPGNLFASTNHFSVSVSVFMVQTCLNLKPRETTSIKMSVHSCPFHFSTV